MTEFNAPFIGQSRARKMFDRLLASGRLSHALLLVGPTGAGKAPLALRWGEALLARETPAGAHYAVGHHPDLLTVPQEGAIKIDMVRQLSTETYTGAAIANGKVAVLTDMERMTEAAQNAFLKTLEEPPAGVYFIATTAYPERLLETVLSRMQIIRLTALRADEIQTLLERAGADTKTAATIVPLAHGNAREAMRLWENPQLLEARHDFVTMVDHLMGAHTGEVIGAMLEEDERLKANHRKEKSPLTLFAYRQNAYKERLLWLREAWHERLLQTASKAEREKYRQLLKHTNTAYRDLTYQGNPRLTLTRYLLEAGHTIEGEE